MKHAPALSSPGQTCQLNQKARVAELESRLSEITQKFSENVLDSTNAWELVIEDESRLAGLPESAKAAAAADAEGKGHRGQVAVHPAVSIDGASAAIRG